MVPREALQGHDSPLRAAVALIAVFSSESLYHLANQPYPALSLAMFCVVELCVIAGNLLFRRRSLAKSRA